MMGMLGQVSVVCACASLIFSIIAIALPYWVYHESTSLKSYFGLWTVCFESQSYARKAYTECGSIEITKDLGYVVVTRGLEITGLLLVAGAGIVGGLKLFVMKENTMLPPIAGFLALAAGIFMIIGTIVFGDKVHSLFEKGDTFHAGFAFAIISGVVAIVTGILFFASTSKCNIHE